MKPDVRLFGELSVNQLEKKIDHLALKTALYIARATLESIEETRKKDPESIKLMATEGLKHVKNLMKGR